MQCTVFSGIHHDRGLLTSYHHITAETTQWLGGWVVQTWGDKPRCGVDLWSIAVSNTFFSTIRIFRVKSTFFFGKTSIFDGNPVTPNISIDIPMDGIFTARRISRKGPRPAWQAGDGNAKNLGSDWNLMFGPWVDVNTLLKTCHKIWYIVHFICFCRLHFICFNLILMTPFLIFDDFDFDDFMILDVYINCDVPLMLFDDVWWLENDEYFSFSMIFDHFLSLSIVTK